MSKPRSLLVASVNPFHRTCCSPFIPDPGGSCSADAGNWRSAPLRRRPGGGAERRSTGDPGTQIVGARPRRRGAPSHLVTEPSQVDQADRKSVLDAAVGILGAISSPTSTCQTCWPLPPRPSRHRDHADRSWHRRADRGAAGWPTRRGAGRGPPRAAAGTGGRGRRRRAAGHCRQPGRRPGQAQDRHPGRPPGPGADQPAPGHRPAHLPRRCLRERGVPAPHRLRGRRPPHRRPARRPGSGCGPPPRIRHQGARPRLCVPSRWSAPGCAGASRSPGEPGSPPLPQPAPSSATRARNSPTRAPRRPAARNRRTPAAGRQSPGTGDVGFARPGNACRGQVPQGRATLAGGAGCQRDWTRSRPARSCTSTVRNTTSRPRGTAITAGPRAVIPGSSRSLRPSCSRSSPSPRPGRATPRQGGARPRGWISPGLPRCATSPPATTCWPSRCATSIPRRSTRGSPPSP